MRGVRHGHPNAVGEAGLHLQGLRHHRSQALSRQGNAARMLLSAHSPLLQILLGQFFSPLGKIFMPLIPI